MSKPKLYLVSGLGADKSIFNFFKTEAFELVMLRWIKPASEEETLDDYLKRLSQKIDLENPNKYILGVSFGGIVALELAKKIKFKKIFLISSIKTHLEAPYSFNFFNLINVKSWAPVGLMKQAAPLVNFIFGAAKKEEKGVLTQLLEKSNPFLVRWSIKTILEWKNTELPENLVHIHGTKDLVFPTRYLSEFIPIKDGTHIMIANRAKEVVKIVEEQAFKSVENLNYTPNA